MARANREAVLAALKNPKEARDAAKPKKEKQGDSKYTAEEKAKMDAEGRGLSGASKGWAEQFKLMNDANTQLYFCFSSDDKLRAFLKRLDLTPDELRAVSGRELSSALGVDEDTPTDKLPARRLKRHKVSAEQVAWNAKYKPHPKPDPGPETGDVAHDVARDLLAWLDWAESNGQDSRWLKKHGNVLDQPHWFVAWFLSQAQVNAFLRLTNFIEVGDCYLDGDRATAILDE